ncbi:MAG: RagB/SusD family nutrient uptake outer membrane protein [Bacteroidales bacterium]
MKKINKIIFGLLLLSSIVSCTDELKFGNDFLNKLPGQDITIDTVFSKSEFAQKFLWNAYSSLWFGLNTDWSNRGVKMGMGLQESMTDNFQSYLNWDNVNAIYYNGKYNSTLESNTSAYNFITEGSWDGIRNGWIFIENVDRVPDMDAALKARLKGEARMIIACHYADMYRHFGGLPLVTKAFTANDNMVLPRATAKETLDFITSLCDSAQKVLPWTLPKDDLAKWDGRFTGGAALGLKIRMLLFGASPLFNSDKPYYTSKSYESVDKKQVWFGGYDANMWNNVVSACQQFFQLNAADPNGGYSLVVGDPQKSYQQAYFTRGNSEILISTRVRATVSYEWDANCYYLQSLGHYGAASPTLNYGDLFPMADGTPFDNSIWNDSLGIYKVNAPGDTTFIDPFANRDPRMYETCLVNNSSYKGRKAELWMGGRERGSAPESGSAPTGMGVYKFIMDLTNATALGAPSQWPYLRLAEIYLSYAEALNQVNKTEEAFTWVDQVRARVGLKGLKDAYPSMVWSQSAFLEQVLRERSCEFGMEEVRWNDLVRWKREGDFRKRLYGVRINRVYRNGALVPNRYTYTKFTLFKRAWQDSDDGTNNFDPKWYLAAFPIAEIYKGYGLTQNPGW